MALMIVVLLGMCGMSLDIANWYLQGSREQKAADAAALAGAVFLPDNPTAAFASARDLAARNGYMSGGSTTVTVTQEPRPSQLRVTITRTIDNFFGALLRLPQTTITRTAVAEFVGPVPMGSPANSFGDEPTGDTTEHWSEIYDEDDNEPQFWANIAGPQSVKVNGDAQHARLCAGAENCSGSNGDYHPNGYFYVVRVPSTPPSGRLAIEVYAATASATPTRPSAASATAISSSAAAVVTVFRRRRRSCCVHRASRRGTRRAFP